MGTLVNIARATEWLGHRALSMVRKDAGPPAWRWNWPSPYVGDMGPPGTWQRNLNVSYDPAALAAFSAVYSCVQKIAGDMAKLPIRIAKVNAQGVETDLPTDPFEQLMRRPNAYQTRVDFVQTLMCSTLLAGNGYVLMIRNGRSEPVELHLWDPRSVQPVIAEDGSVFYRMGSNRLAGFPDGLTAPARDVIHHRLPMGAGYPLIGVTPIFAAAASSNMGLRILQQSQQFFGNAARPSGLLSSDQNIPTATASEFKQRWKANYADGGVGETAVLGNGMKWTSLALTATDSQLIEQLRFSIEDVARVFHVPTFMIGDTSKVTYRNSEQLGRVYLQGCLGYHIEALQTRFNDAFEFGRDYRLIFDLDALLKTDIDTRYTAFSKGLAAGWLRINEVRALEGYGPVPGGSESFLQSQYRPISQLINPPKPVAAPPGPTVAPAPAKPANEDTPPQPGAQQAAELDPAAIEARVAELMEST